MKAFHIPRWKVCCWIAALASASGREVVVSLYFGELVTCAVSGDRGGDA